MEEIEKVLRYRAKHSVAFNEAWLFLLLTRPSVESLSTVPRCKIMPGTLDWIGCGKILSGNVDVLNRPTPDV
jgi:hypothetical protein